MDFSLGETQQAIIRVAADVLGDVSRQRPARAAGSLDPAPAARPGPRPDHGDLALWKELGQAGLLSLALPGSLGGEGLGPLDIGVLLTEIGRRAAVAPALATLAMGVLPVVRQGDAAQQRALLAGVATGDTVLTAAVREPSAPFPAEPTTAVSQGAVSGVKVGVPYAAVARWILVPARFAGGGTGVVVVEPTADGVQLTRTPSSAGDPEYTVRLSRAPVARVLSGSDDGAAVAGLYQCALAGAACMADGALAAALTLTCAHVESRRQFGRPLAAFQAVSQQMADIYIASRTLHLAALSACWRLEAGLDAGEDLDVAGYWLADQAPAAMLTCHHLHGGLGMDVTYPLHRFSALVKDLVRLVGGTEHRLAALGDRVCG